MYWLTSPSRVAALALGFLMGLPLSALGQSVGEITANNVTWEPKYDGSELPFQVSYQNCVDNDAFLFKDAEFSTFAYNQFLTPEQRASECTECLTCLEKCPQQINIPEELKKVHQTLVKKASD